MFKIGWSTVVFGAIRGWSWRHVGASPHSWVCKRIVCRQIYMKFCKKSGSRRFSPYHLRVHRRNGLGMRVTRTHSPNTAMGKASATLPFIRSSRVYQSLQVQLILHLAERCLEVCQIRCKSPSMTGMSSDSGMGHLPDIYLEVLRYSIGTNLKDNFLYTKGEVVHK